jgi:hypothetical protein
MSTTRLAIAVQDNIRPTMRTRLLFHFPQIEGVEFDDTSVLIHAGTPLPADKLTSVVTSVNAHYTAISDRLHTTVVNAPDLVKSDAAAIRAAAQRLIAQVEATEQSVYDEVLVPQRGVNLYAGRSAATVRAIDDFLRTLAELAYDATEVRVPSMLSADVVDRAGYFDTGCQHLSFVAPMTTDLETFESFLPYWRSGDGHDQLHRFLRTPTNVLNPALCLHAYPMMAGRPADGTVLTMSGSCFRDESGNLNNRERLREFTMREAIFFGDQASLGATHPRLVATMAAIAELFGFKYQLSTATDIFFNDSAQAQLFSQLVSDSKIELLVQVDDGGPVAVASINKHGQHFTKPFGITDGDGTTPSTICMAFGLDRMLLALRGVTRLSDHLRQGLARIGGQA